MPQAIEILLGEGSFRVYRHRIGAIGVDLVPDGDTGAVADADHHDDRRHSYDYTEARQR